MVKVSTVRMLTFLAPLWWSVAEVAAQTREAAPPDADPNELICRNMRETGSRLNTNRVCMTREQWIQRRREMRQNIDRAQTNRVYPGQ